MTTQYADLTMMKPHSFCITSQCDLKSYADALASIRAKHAIAPASQLDFGMVRHHAPPPSKWLVFQVQDGLECQYSAIHTTPHRVFQQLERAIGYLNFLSHYEPFSGSRIGLRKIGKQWLVFRVHEQQQSYKPLNP